MPGGAADNIPDESMPKDQMAKGKEEEKEHTSDPGIAKEIAKDHIAEDPKYYDKHKKMEEKKAAKIKEVAVIGVIKDGKILMGKRRDNSRWTNPGGHLNEGEQPVQGAIRELEEETGIQVSAHQLKHLATEIVSKPGGGSIRVHAYKVDLGDKTPTSMKNDPDGEVFRWHWVNASGNNNDNIYGNLHVPVDKNVLLKALGMTQEKAASFISEYYNIFGEFL